MNTDFNPVRHPTKRRTRAIATLAGITAAAAVLLATMGCSGSVVHNYRTFRPAPSTAARCSELYDQRSRYDDESILAKIDHDLDSIGCTSPDATETTDITPFDWRPKQTTLSRRT